MSLQNFMTTVPRSSHRSKRRSLLIFCLWLWTLPAAAQSALIEIGLEAVQTTHVANEKVNVRFSLKNNSDQPIEVLKWHTPLEGAFTFDMFEVVKGGQKVPYIGKLVKRPPPTDADYLKLLPGAQVTAIVDLAEGYALYDIGRYAASFRDTALKMKFNGATTNARQANTNQQGTALKQGATFEIIETRAQPQALFKQPPRFNGCSSSRQATLNQALTNAENIALTARNDLDNTPLANRSGAPRYIEWFGTYNVSRYQTVSDHFNSIYDAASNKIVDFDCTCTEPFFAFVFPSDPYRIFLCSVFWIVDPLGTDSQAGTIIHELSHFNVVANTHDYAYGQVDARNLAEQNPALAVFNADSHEYFAENTPFLAMMPAASSQSAPFLPAVFELIILQ